MNKIRNLFKLCLVFLVFLLPEATEAQSLSLNHSFLNDYYRQQQLLGRVDPALSFVIRPLTSQALQSKQLFDPQGKVNHLDELPFGGSYSFYKGDGKLDLLPISLLSQYNSHHPEGYNDGAMIPARGGQMRLDLGLHVEYKWCSLTLNPELVYAHNKLYEGYPQSYKTSLGLQFPPSKGTIDLPERMGDFHYTKLHWGQSSLRVNYKSLSLGVSSENLWWGPGYKNSLLMSNTAPGFLHATFNTRSPIQTMIGAFEGQLIAGKLEESGYTPDLRDDWRYINAMVFSYQPRWVPGLFLGMTRSFIVYHEDMGSGLGAWLPVFSFLSKSSGGSNEEVDSQGEDQRISAFVRWLFPAVKGEVYAEFGREDHSWDNRDYLLEPAHSSAYILGFRKLIALNRESHIQVIGELTHMSANSTTLNRRRDYNRPAGGGWYHHYQVKHGYTHEGQLLGTGVDPNSNTQTLNISWNRGMKQIGLELERYLHNNNFWYDYIKDFRANWVDLSASAFAHWDYRHFLLYGKAKLIRSKNYQWLYEPTWPEVQADYWTHTDDTFNFHLQVGVTYRF